MTYQSSRSNKKPLKLVDQFTYLGSNISSTEIDVNIRIGKAWTAIDKFSVIEKSGISDKIVRFGTTVWLHHMDSNEHLE